MCELQNHPDITTKEAGTGCTASIMNTKQYKNSVSPLLQGTTYKERVVN